MGNPVVTLAVMRLWMHETIACLAGDYHVRFHWTGSRQTTGQWKVRLTNVKVWLPIVRLAPHSKWKERSSERMTPYALAFSPRHNLSTYCSGPFVSSDAQPPKSILYACVHDRVLPFARTTPVFVDPRLHLFALCVRE